MQKKEKKKLSSPPIAASFPFHLEIDKTARGLSLSCTGVKGISEFSDNEIELKTSSFSLIISGKKLYMTVYEGKCVEVIGRFSEVKFIYDKS